MKILELMTELWQIHESHGDLEVYLKNDLSEFKVYYCDVEEKGFDQDPNRDKTELPKRVVINRQIC